MKILHKEISCCAECPYKDYECGNSWKCLELDRFIEGNIKKIHKDCPLPDKQEQTPIRTSSEN